jgi:hypothetical protein
MAMKLIKWHRTESGFVSHDKRFKIVKRDVCGFRNGCYVSVYDLYENEKRIDSELDTKREAVDIAEGIVEEEVAEAKS